MADARRVKALARRSALDAVLALAKDGVKRPDVADACLRQIVEIAGAPDVADLERVPFDEALLAMVKVYQEVYHSSVDADLVVENMLKVLRGIEGDGWLIVRSEAVEW